MNVVGARPGGDSSRHHLRQFGGGSNRAGLHNRSRNTARLALFSSGLSTDIGERALRRTFYDVGAQVDLSMVLFSNLDSTLSVGYATAKEKGRNSNEVMLSLKLLR